MDEIGQQKGLSIRVWSPERAPHDRGWRSAPPIAPSRRWRCCGPCATARCRPKPAVMIGNRPNCRSVAEQFGVEWHMIGDANGNPDDERLTALCDEYDVDYLVLARYMRILLAGGLLEIRRRPDHQPAPRPAAQLSRHPSVPRSLRQPHADLRRHLPLHRARLGRRQSDHLSIAPSPCRRA